MKRRHKYLTAFERAEARDMLASGVSTTVVRKKYGVSRQAVGHWRRTLNNNGRRVTWTQLFLELKYLQSKFQHEGDLIEYGHEFAKIVDGYIDRNVPEEKQRTLCANLQKSRVDFYVADSGQANEARPVLVNKPKS